VFAFLRIGGALFAAIALLAAKDARANTTGKVFLHTTSRELVANGHAFGDAGPYEKIRGTVELQVDPNNPRNAIITDIELAPRNAEGLVTFDADFMILRPADMSRWNRKLVAEVNNRGNVLLFIALAGTSGGNDPSTVADFGNGLLLEDGYALAWVGWAPDVRPGGGRQTIRVPRPTFADGTPVRQRITIELADEFNFPVDGSATCVPLSGSPTIAGYPAVLSEAASAELLVRTSDSPRPSAPWIPLGTLIPRDQWFFDGPDRICLTGNFQPGKVYQLNYVAEDTRIMGLGYAAWREFGAFLRYRAADDAGVPNPLAPHGGVAYSIIFGASQSGVYLRDFLYQGFNEDLAGRRVFDGMHVHIAGAVKLGLNYRFGQIHPWSTQRRDRHIPQVTFPFNYGVRINPLVAAGLMSGPLYDGILKRPATDPLVVQTDSSNEYWWAQASLVDTDGFGNDVPMPSNARHYVITGTQHFARAGAVPALGTCQQLNNPVHQGPAMRAIFMNLDAWVSQGIAPPASRRATVRNGLLVPPENREQVGFPAIPGVTYNGFYNALGELDFGPSARENRGIITNWGHPPVIAEYRVLVPKVDNLGIDRGGVEVPQVGVPTATLTGWNLRRAPFAEGDLCELNGMYLPLAETEADKRDAGDRRPSLEELYGSHRGYVNAVSHFVRESVRDRFLLSQDAAQAIEDADRSDVLR
jgi:hypothetical protein